MPGSHSILRRSLRLGAIVALIGLGALAHAILSGEGSTLFARNAVAIVNVTGVIDEVSETVRLLDRLRENDSIHAIVMRLDSPGGGVAASQELYDAVWRLRGRKPVVASLGNLAASGGYYVASACDHIVANPGTLTGSIGVIMQMGNYSELLKKLGLVGFVIKAGKYKDIGSPLREMTAEERKLLEDVLENVHAQFIGAVARGRGLPLETVRTVSDGRIFSGEQALSLRLVDQLGGLRDAVHVAATRAGIPGEPQWIEFDQRQPTWWWRRLRGLVEQGASSTGGLSFLWITPGSAG